MTSSTDYAACDAPQMTREQFEYVEHVKMQEVVRCRRKQMPRLWRISNPKPKSKKQDWFAAMLSGFFRSPTFVRTRSE